MKKIWDAEELAAVWSLNHDEMKLLKTKPPRNHLGFAAQLKFYRFSGRFLQNSSEISDTPLQYLAEQLNVTASDIEAYDFANRSGKRHRSEILTFLGVQRV
ncbi:MAG: DUF4158 domain-containing protein, partial [Syntrophotalea acetylenica]|nr:DUF4158 domain-containing protein [Syntrophotalea acetylenica]